MPASLRSAVSQLVGLQMKRIARSISLPLDLETLSKSLVRSGRYASASEVIRAGLRLLETHEEQRRQQIADNASLRRPRSTAT